jgi:hypothetical protein
LANQSAKLRAAISLTLAGVLSMALAACTADTSPPGSPAAFFGHIHGLAADPSTGQTYAATHTGVWLLPTTGLPTSYPVADTDVQAPIQIAERWQDTRVSPWPAQASSSAPDTRTSWSNPTWTHYVGGDAPWILIADERGVIASDDYGATVTTLLTAQD